ncbi:MAG: hypothetical protein COB69_02415 [Phycisphaera sp.]|nr:MAG: hypothetical protein COB69_02415 [Phycisphaera sp.]
MSTLHLRESDLEIISRVRYHKKTRRAVTLLRHAGATTRTDACRSSEIGLIHSPYSWWLSRRGVIRRTGSGKYWLDTKRQEKLSAGAPVRVVMYLAIAGLLSGATMAMAAAGF